MSMIIFLVVVVVVVFLFIGMYNRLVTARNAFKNAFAQIDVQLTRRYDLIPEPGRDRQGISEARARDARERDPRAQHCGRRA